MINKRTFTTGLRLLPTTETLSLAGELQTVGTQIKLHNGTSASPLVTEAHTAVLTNKTLGSAGTTILDNILEGISGSAITIRSASNQNLTVQAQGTGVLSLSGTSTSVQSFSFTTNTLTSPTGAAGTIQSDTNQNLTVQAQGTGNLSLLGTQVTVKDIIVTSNTITGASGSFLQVRSASNENFRLIAQGSGQLSLNVTDGGQVNIKNLVVTNDTITGSGSGTLVLTTQTNQSISLTPDGTGIINLSNNTKVLAGIDFVQSVDSSSTGSDQTVTYTTSSVKFTNASLASIAGITGGRDGRVSVITNGTGATLVIKNQSGAPLAANRIITGTGADLSVADGASVIAIYDSNSSRWRVVGGSGAGGFATNGGGTRGTPTNVVAGTTITVANLKQSVIYVQGDSGHVTMTANPQLTTSGIEEHNILVVRGRNDSQTVTLVNGNGLSLNGNCTLAADDSITLMFDGTNYVELSRS
jgi:hypothetical protein